VELGVVYVAGEAGPVPDDHALDGLIGAAQVLEHGFEGEAAYDAGGGAGVLVDVMEDVVMITAPGGNDSLLLLEGEVLIITAGVTQIGDEEGTRGKRNLEHEEHEEDERRERGRND